MLLISTIFQVAAYETLAWMVGVSGTCNVHTSHAHTVSDGWSIFNLHVMNKKAYTQKVKNIW